jgi:ArpU family phage transcriptional regulator
LITEQLSLLEDIPKREYYRTVVQQLKDYPQIKKALEKSNLHQDKIKLEMKRIKAELVEAALDQLDDEELSLIKQSYFEKRKPKDVQLMRKLGMAKTCFYKTKDEAIRKIATVFNIL